MSDQFWIRVVTGNPTCVLNFRKSVSVLSSMWDSDFSQEPVLSALVCCRVLPFILTDVTVFRKVYTLSVFCQHVMSVIMLFATSCRHVQCSSINFHLEGYLSKPIKRCDVAHHFLLWNGEWSTSVHFFVHIWILRFY